MTTKEKAKEILEKYGTMLQIKTIDKYYYSNQCALLLCDEMIIQLNECSSEDKEILTPYWEEVKREIIRG